MPSKTRAQHNLMAMVANDPAAAKRVGIPQSVGQEYMKADKGRKFGSGGTDTRADAQAINKPKTHHGASAFFSRGGAMKEVMGPRTMAREVEKGKKLKFGEHGDQHRGHTRGKNFGDTGPTAPIMKAAKKGGTMKYAKGGVIIGEKQGSMGLREGHKKHGEHAIQAKGHTKARQVVMKRGGRVC